jgi:hypothetical protein
VRTIVNRWIDIPCPYLLGTGIPRQFHPQPAGRLSSLSRNTAAARNARIANGKMSSTAIQ